jgi:oxygen-dependent protoporphyrinogen oxidase
MQDVEAIVIGAGIAGLTAAWRLQQQGWDVSVLEASGRVGGRMATHRNQGFLIDSGAQFLSSGYRLIPALAAEFGLHIQKTESAASAVLHDARLRVMHSDRPFDAVRSGLMSPWAWLRHGTLLAGHGPALRQRSLSDYSDWADLDDQNTDHWVRRKAHAQSLERVLEPILEGFYFQQPETTSRALALMVSAFSWRKHHTVTLCGGMGALPQALASRLPVHYNEPAIQLVERDDCVEIQTVQRRYRARHVVCAVPALHARRLWPTAPAAEQSLMETAYSSGINIAILADARYTLPQPLQSVYGILIPRSERGHLAALAVEGNKCRDRAPAGTLLNVMLSDAAAQKCMVLSDDELLQTIQPEIEAYAPGLFAARIGTHCYRWPQAEPRSPVGRARAISDYRRTAGMRRILLAGDYMGAPYTEGAAETGAWAASQVAQSRTIKHEPER